MFLDVNMSRAGFEPGTDDFQLQHAEMEPYLGPTNTTFMFDDL